MKHKHNYLWIASSFLLAMTMGVLASCTKEIEFKGEQTDPRLVINSVVEPGQPVKARMSKSVFFLDNSGDMEAPSDLVATLFVNGNNMGEMTKQLDTIWGTEYYWNPEPVYTVLEVYASPYLPVEGDEVSIRATAEGFDPVEGSTGTLPDSPACRIKSLRLIETEKWPTAYDDDIDTVWHYSDKYELIIELTDTNPDHLDCFFMDMDESYHYFDTLDQYNYNWNAYISDYSDPIFGAISNTQIDIIDDQTESNGTFTDRFFDGHTYDVKLTINFSHSSLEGITTEPYRVAFYVYHITKDYYDYLNTCEQGDEAIQFFAEPIQTHTNVNGGYGIVGGRTVETLWIEFP